MRVKVTQRLVLTLAVAGALVFTGCDSEKVETLQKTREELVKVLADSSDKLVSNIDQLKKENTNLRVAVEMQDRQIDELSRQIRNLQEQAGIQQKKIEDEKAAEAAGKWTWLWWILGLGILGLIVVMIAIKVMKPKPFEEDEDDDLSQFDDDYGVDDEDDDFGDDADTKSESKE